MEKRYICEDWPFFQLGEIQFFEGVYATSDEAVQEMIESSESYGSRIQLDDSSEEEEPEPSRRGRGSGARQGSTGTGNLR